jgi:hypothetical protein
VQILPLPREVLAPSLKLTVQVTGCDAVTKVRVYERDQALLETDATGTTTTVEVLAKAIDFKSRGAAADLTLKGEGLCASGQSAKSDAVPVTFMPAAEVLPGPWPFTNFWVDADGDSFLSCTREVVRHGKDRSRSAAKVTLPFDCGQDADLAFAPDGMRYLSRPGFGFAAFTSSLEARFDVSLDGLKQLLVPAQGSIVAVGYNEVVHSLHSYGRTSGKEEWASTVGGPPVGALVKDRLGRIVYPLVSFPAGGSTGDLGVERYDSRTGKLTGTHAFGRIRTEVLSTTPIPPLSFDETGDTAYFADLNDPGVVTACDAISDNVCSEVGKGLKWRSPPLSGGVVSAVRTPSGLVALGPRVAYFLDPATGAPLSKPVSPTGSLAFRHVLAGADSGTTLLALKSGEPGIKEVVLFDAPGSEAARFVTGGSGYVVDLDPQGRLLLLGADLFRLLPGSEYRRVR